VESRTIENGENVVKLGRDLEKIFQIIARGDVNI